MHGGSILVGLACFLEVPAHNDASLFCCSHADPDLGFDWAQQYATASHALTILSQRHQPPLRSRPRLARGLLAGVTLSIQLAAAALPTADGKPAEQSASLYYSQSKLEDIWGALAQLATIVDAEWMQATLQRKSQASFLRQLLQDLTQLSLATLAEDSSRLSAEQLAAAIAQQLAARVHMLRAVCSIAQAVSGSPGGGTTQNSAQLAHAALQLVQEAAGATQRLVAEQEQLLQMQPGLAEDQPSALLEHTNLLASLVRLGSRSDSSADRLPAYAAAAAAAQQVLSLLSQRELPSAIQKELDMLTLDLSRLLSAVGSSLSELSTAGDRTLGVVAQLTHAHLVACRLVHAGGSADTEQQHGSLLDSSMLLQLVLGSYFAIAAALTHKHGRWAGCAEYTKLPCRQAAMQASCNRLLFSHAGKLLQSQQQRLRRCWCWAAACRHELLRLRFVPTCAVTAQPKSA